MRLRVEIGDSRTEEWGDPVLVDLVPYSQIWEEEHPDIPPYPGIDESVALKDHPIDIGGQTIVAVTLNHHIPKNTATIIVKHNGQSFVQAMGVAYDEDGAGLSLLFVAPGTSVPVNLTCEP